MSFPNVLRGDKWFLSFSNIPTVKDRHDLRLFDNYIKSFTLPSYDMGEITSHGPLGFNVRHPIGGIKINDNLSPITVDFKLSENMDNYLYLFRWMLELKYGRLKDDYDGMIRKYYIDAIHLHLLDNQKRTTTLIKFTHGFLTNLSSIPLVFGSSPEITFTCTFTYEEIVYSTVDPMVGGTKLDEPNPDCQPGPQPLDTSATWD
ncbi:MAG: hypothetical protein ACOCZ5_01265 [bacterium]